jgi:hypothetical protein
VGPRGVYDEAKRHAGALTTAYRIAHGGHDMGLHTAIVGTGDGPGAELWQLSTP